MLPDLTAYGVDLNAGLARMDGNESLYLFFLLQFPQDESLARTRSALARGDAAQAFSCAHDLKGLSAQLGLERLAGLCEALCGCLGEPGGPSERAKALFSLAEDAYAQALRGIGQIRA